MGVFNFIKFLYSLIVLIVSVFMKLCFLCIDFIIFVIFCKNCFVDSESSTLLFFCILFLNFFESVCVGVELLNVIVNVFGFLFIVCLCIVCFLVCVMMFVFFVGCI